MSLPSHPDLLAEKLQTRSILTLHLVSFQGVRSYTMRGQLLTPVMGCVGTSGVDAHMRPAASHIGIARGRVLR